MGTSCRAEMTSSDPPQACLAAGAAVNENEKTENGLRALSHVCTVLAATSFLLQLNLVVCQTGRTRNDKHERSACSCAPVFVLLAVCFGTVAGRSPLLIGRAIHQHLGRDDHQPGAISGCSDCLLAADNNKPTMNNIGNLDGNSDGSGTRALYSMMQILPVSRLMS
jgi:hypothetical protein